MANTVKSSKTGSRSVLRSCEHNSLRERLLGGFAVASFVAVWLSSLLSPLLLLCSIYYENMKPLLTAITILVAIAYAPWKRGTISKSIGGFFHHYHARYYNSYKWIMHHDPSCNNDTKSGAKRNLFYAIHPHGAFCLGWSTLFCALPEVKFCFSPVLYMSPFFRLFSRLTGNPGTADKPTMISYMKQSFDLALPPGGFEEATLTSLQHDRVYIKKRIGICQTMPPVRVFDCSSLLFW